MQLSVISGMRDRGCEMQDRRCVLRISCVPVYVFTCLLPSIQPMLANVFIHRPRDEIAKFQSLFHAATDLTRGDLEQGRFDEADFFGEARQDRLERVELDGFARAAHHANSVAGPHEVRGAMPSVEAAQRIRAQQKGQVRGGVLSLEDFQRLDRELRRGAVEFERGKFEGGFIGEGEFQHLDAMTRLCDEVPHFVRRDGREHPDQARELQALTRFAREDEMTQMRRVEGSAKKSNAG